MTSKLLRLAPALAAAALLLPAAADAKGGKGNGNGNGHGRPAWAGPPAAAAPTPEPGVIRGAAVEEPVQSEPTPEAPATVVDQAPPAPVAPVTPEVKAPRKAKLKAKTFVFQGRVVAVDASAGTVDVLVRKGNSRGRRFRGEVVTFALSGAVVEAVETDGVAGTSAGDVLEGDAVVVQARLAQAARPDGTVVAARKLVDLAEREPAPVSEPVVAEPEPVVAG